MLNKQQNLPMDDKSVLERDIEGQRLRTKQLEQKFREKMEQIRKDHQTAIES